MAKYGDKAYKHAKLSGDENWTPERSNVNAKRTEEYEMRLKSFKEKHGLQGVSGLKNVDSRRQFEAGDTLYPILTDHFGMNEHTAFLVMTKMLHAGINVDLWQVGDSVELKADGTLKGKHEGADFEVPDILSPSGVPASASAASGGSTGGVDASGDETAGGDAAPSDPNAYAPAPSISPRDAADAVAPAPSTAGAGADVAPAPSAGGSSAAGGAAPSATAGAPLPRRVPTPAPPVDAVPPPAEAAGGALEDEEEAPLSEDEILVEKIKRERGYDGGGYTFVHDAVWVQKGNDQFHVGRDGEPLYDTKFKLAYHFYNERYAEVEDHNDKQFHINRQGQPAYKEKFDEIQDGGALDSGSAKAFIGGDKYTITLQPDGRIVVAKVPAEPALPPTEVPTSEGDRIKKIQKDGGYDEVGNGFYDGALWVRKGSEMFHVDEEGKPLYAVKFKEAHAFVDGFAKVKDENDKYFHIDTNGTPAYTEKFDRVSGGLDYTPASGFIGSDEYTITLDKANKKLIVEKQDVYGVPSPEKEYTDAETISAAINSLYPVFRNFLKVSPDPANPGQKLVWFEKENYLKKMLVYKITKLREETVYFTVFNHEIALPLSSYPTPDALQKKLDEEIGKLVPPLPAPEPQPAAPAPAPAPAPTLPAAPADSTPVAPSEEAEREKKLLAIVADVSAKGIQHMGISFDNKSLLYTSKQGGRPFIVEIDKYPVSLQILVANASSTLMGEVKIHLNNPYQATNSYIDREIERIFAQPLVPSTSTSITPEYLRLRIGKMGDQEEIDPIERPLPAVVHFEAYKDNPKAPKILETAIRNLMDRDQVSSVIASIKYFSKTPYAKEILLRIVDSSDGQNLEVQFGAFVQEPYALEVVQKYAQKWPRRTLSYAHILQKMQGAKDFFLEIATEFPSHVVNADIIIKDPAVRAELPSWWGEVVSKAHEQVEPPATATEDVIPSETASKIETQFENATESLSVDVAMERGKREDIIRYYARVAQELKKLYDAKQAELSRSGKNNEVIQQLASFYESSLRKFVSFRNAAARSEDLEGIQPGRDPQKDAQEEFDAIVEQAEERSTNEELREEFEP